MFAAETAVTTEAWAFSSSAFRSATKLAWTCQSSLAPMIVLSEPRTSVIFGFMSALAMPYCTRFGPATLMTTVFATLPPTMNPAIITSLPPSTCMRVEMLKRRGGFTIVKVAVTVQSAVTAAVVNVVPPSVLVGNFFPNPTFELGLQLDDPIFGSPSGGWQRGGSASSIDQVTVSNSVSSSHSLALVDNNAANYGEWYLFMSLTNLISDGDVLDLQWFQIYSTSDGNMRLSFAFVDAGNVTLASQDFNVNGQSPGWNGTVASSPFERQYRRLEVPVGTTQLRVNLASGGSSTVTGTMVIDDLSVRLSQPLITDVTADASGVNLTWNSVPSKTYTVLFTGALGGSPSWAPLTTGLASGGLTTSYQDTAMHSGNQGFYRVMEE